MNNLFNQLNPLSQRLPNNIKNMINTFKTIQNPQAKVHEMLSSNPQLKSMIDASNGNPEQAFRSLAKQMNIDPDEFIRMLK